MPSIINAVAGGAGGLVGSGDASGTLQIQTGGVTAITVGADQSVAFAGTVSGLPPPSISRVSTAAYPTDTQNSTSAPLVNTGTGVFTFTVPSDVNKIKASFVAAGGGSGGGQSSNAPGGGGGGGGIVAYIPVTPGLVLTITLGAGVGTGATGNASSITGTGISLSASGGSTGVVPYNGGRGGTGTITSIPAGGVAYVVQGNPGQSGAANNSGIGGGVASGGGSMLGGGDGGASGVPGWGGGASNGAASGAGFCVIEY